MKDFLKSQGLRFITKAIHPTTNRVFFIFQKCDELDQAITKWQKINNY